MWGRYEEEDRCATPMEAMREYAYNVGGDARYVDSQWILTDYDVWVSNPHYRGKPQPHPDTEMTQEEFDAEEAVRAVLAAEKAAALPPTDPGVDDDIPF